MNNKTGTQPPPRNRLLDLMTGYWLSQAIYVAAKLELCDALDSEPKSATALAQKLGCHEDSLYRLLRALASQGIGEEHPDRHFTATEMSDNLRRDSDRSLWAMAVMMGEEHYTAWGQLLDGVRHGDVPFEKVFGKPVFAFFDEHEEAAAVFNRAMTEHAMLTHRAAVDAYDFAPFQTVVDVGGGHGALLSTILSKHEHLSAILFDQPAVVENLPSDGPLAQAGVAGRCRVVGGDFFDDVPAGGDLYVMSAVIHDWDDSQAETILRNVRRVTPAAGRLLLVERVLAEANAPDFGKLGDLNMLVMTGGRERTEREYAELLERAGFRLNQVHPTRAASSLVEATCI